MKRKHRTRHHVVPRSRCKALGVKPNNPNNIVMVDSHKHELYHALFQNFLPSEIMDYLIREFWGGKTPYDYRKFKGKGAWC